MKLMRLYIGDFGIFRNQTMEDIGPGIVIIGGLNRAGKSTFMEILRYIAWGFPKNCSFPFSGDKYDIQCDMVSDSEDIYNVRIAGFGEPSVNMAMGKDRDTSSTHELYTLDPFTYHRIFTINLNELQKIPTNVTGKEVEKLQSVLLGAGLSDLVRIPHLMNDFSKEAEKIGGKHGRSVKQFKPYFDQIKKSLVIKKKALAQVDEYQRKQEELKSINYEITLMENEIKDINAQITQLDVLKSNYDEYTKISDLTNKIEGHEAREWANGFPLKHLGNVKVLKDDYKRLVNNYEKCILNFRSSTGQEDTEPVRKKINEYKQEIRNFGRSVSGLNEKINNYYKNRDTHKQQGTDILSRLKKADSDWGEEAVLKVKNISVDQINENRLIETIEDYREKKGKLENLQEANLILSNQIEFTEKQIVNLKTPQIQRDIKKLIYWASICVVLGIVMFFITPWPGIILAGAGIVGAGMYFMYKAVTGSQLSQQKITLQENLTRLKSEMEGKNSVIEELNESIGKMERILENWGSRLGLQGRVSPDLLRERFRTVRELQDSILKWENLGQASKSDFEEINRELSYISNIIGELSGRREDSSSITRDCINNSQQLFDDIENWNKYLEVGEELESIERSKKEMEEKLINLMDNKGGESRSDTPVSIDLVYGFIEKGNKVKEYIHLIEEKELVEKKILHILKTQRVREAFSLSDVGISEDDSELKDGFYRQYEEYVSLQDIEKHYNNSTKEFDISNNNLEKLKQKRQSCSDDIQRLATTENLERAQREIDEARSGLRLMAEKFAVYNAAASILEKVQNNFIEEMKETILNKAAGIFAGITDGDYKQILPPEKLTEPDFQTVHSSGGIYDNTDILSRGTCEQLYLAVRISRIMDIDPPLPVIIDDSFVNFDLRHMRQCIKVLSELSRSHQIFILTCHPELVKEIDVQNLKAQYWKLESGKFTLSDNDWLVNHLSC